MDVRIPLTLYNVDCEVKAETYEEVRLIHNSTSFNPMAHRLSAESHSHIIMSQYPAVVDNRPLLKGQQ